MWCEFNRIPSARNWQNKRQLQQTLKRTGVVSEISANCRQKTGTRQQLNDRCIEWPFVAQHLCCWWRKRHRTWRRSSDFKENYARICSILKKSASYSIFPFLNNIKKNNLTLKTAQGSNIKCLDLFHNKWQELSQEGEGATKNLWGSYFTFICWLNIDEAEFLVDVIVRSAAKSYKRSLRV